jgi:hypothetical protein
LELHGGRDIIQESPGEEAVATKMLDRLTKAFSPNQDNACKSIYKVFSNEIESVSIPNAVQSMGKEQGLSKRCC